MAVCMNNYSDCLSQLSFSIAINNCRSKSLDDLNAVFMKADYDRSGSLGKADFAG